MTRRLLQLFKCCAPLSFVLFFCNQAIAGAAMTNSESIVISTQLGEVEGKRAGNVATFYGLPYAKNPFTEARRFQAPQAIEAWSERYDARTMTQPVPQPSRGKTTTLVGAPGDLTVNIWTPASAINTQQALPVMVWLPGGAFIREDAAEQAYDGSHFARHNVVIVTVNYRVGVDGFMHIKGAPDNRGILDQILALQWVQDNIQDYGGDPANVTLFGQSAGAGSVAILLGTKQANGLFHKAIMQSPPMQAMTQSQAAKVSHVFASKLKVPATIEGLSSVKFDALVAGVVDMGNSITDRSEWGMLSWGGTAFLPVIDKALILNSPMVNLANNANPSMPIIVGSTDQESRLYLVPGGEIDRIREDQVSLFLRDLHLGNEAAKVYQKTDDASHGDIYADIQSDYTFRVPALRIAELLSNKGNPVWKYNFSWQSPAYDGRLGAGHFVDVPFTFGTIHSEEAANFVGQQPPETLSTLMQTQWLLFAKTSQPQWGRYNQTERLTLRFDTQSKELKDPNKAVRTLWQDYPF
ncbi:carboxylesterase/lipase family protein [Paraglaciecola sp.]|uniref:carboxylesterase/lipase family protein n=1 Tax=Paraglaciecola sp. TaxID=1920173 RepID=UPI00273D0852|nr:carboxylesterase family protein [Paraglaciecola sp.]MDP5032094.1 carboxylesterase family protein [Paraglaciecola sp.]